MFSNFCETEFGVENIWKDQIWPQVVEILSNVVLCALESGSMDASFDMKNAFELYGADFMLSFGKKEKQVKVWLIEINSDPMLQVGGKMELLNELSKNVLSDTVGCEK